MAQKTTIDQFVTVVNNWKKLDFSKIYREELGVASLITLKPRIEDLIFKLDKISSIKEIIGENTLLQLTQSYARIYNQLNALIKTSTESQFINSKPQAIEQIYINSEQIYDIWPQVLALLAEYNKLPNVDNLMNQIKAFSEKSEADSKLIEDLKLRLTSELDSFEKRYREQFQKAELIKQSDIFSIQADDYKKQSVKWLWGIIISSIILILVLWLVFKYFCFELNCFCNIGKTNYESICKDCNSRILNLEIFKAIAYRLFIISFIVYIINFCVKNYNAIKHNFTINSHKANSLNAALVLLERAKTPEGNDSIMNQAASAIFSHQPTGYSTKDPENISSTVTEKIIEKINPLK